MWRLRSVTYCLPLDLKEGVNAIPYAGATAQVEPDSVILPAARAVDHALQILEQDYRNDQGFGQNALHYLREID